MFALKVALEAETPKSDFLFARRGPILAPLQGAPQ
jgi:hypothetical protein